MKRFISLIMCILLTVISAGCGKENGNSQNNKVVDNSNLQTESNTVENSQYQSNANITEEENPGADNYLGLRNIKIDSTTELTEEQKLVSQYFDNDYIDITDYEFLARYPSIFEGAQIYFTGTIQKIIKSTDEDYEMLVWVGKNEGLFYYRDSNMGVMYDEYKEKTKNNLIVIKGKQTDTRLVTGDDIVVYGRYNKIETTIIDKISYTVPTINAYRTFFNKGISSPDVFEPDFIKKVATVLFGNSVEVRNASDGEDYDSSAGAGECTFDDNPFMICEPENQSNSKFTKYRMYLKNGIIEDAKSSSSIGGTGTSVDDSNIIRKFEFTPDFQHYLIYTFDTDLKTLTVGYYDENFNKIWQRDFEETINGVYDYTQKNFYIVANNDLYIIDMTTGTDVTTPSYVGTKSDIRKVSDGLIMLSASNADSVMKVDLEGNIVWKTNITNEYYIFDWMNSVQFVDKKIIIANPYVSFELDAETGELKTTGELVG